MSATTFKITVDNQEYEVRSEMRTHIAVFITHVQGEDITFGLNRQYEFGPLQYKGKVNPQLLTKIADAIINLEELDEDDQGL